MSYVAEFDFDHPNIMLGKFKDDCDDAVIRIAYSTHISGDTNVAFAIINQTTDWGRVQSTLEADSTIHAPELIFKIQNRAVYIFEWEGQGLDIWTETARHHVFVERVWATGGEWHARLHLPSRQLVGHIREFLENRGFDVSLNNLHAFNSPTDKNNVTSSQIHLLQKAHQQGYFSVPREINQEELANACDITESAVSQQIRRGLDNVLSEYFQYGGNATEYVYNEFFENSSSNL